MIASWPAMCIAILLYVQNLDAVPQISIQYNQYGIVKKLNGEPFNLTAEVASNVPLTSLFWSPPEYSTHLPYRTITFNHGNITTTTFILLKNASMNNEGWYTLTAVNKCGQTSSQVIVEVVYTGKV